MNQLKVQWVRGYLSVIALEALGLGEFADVDTRKREPLSKGADLLAEFYDGLGTFSIAVESDTLEILEQLGTCLLLQLQSELNGTVQELGYRLEMSLLHAP
jgi:hypothetical protein